jgi:hypothetical protein
MKILKPDGTVIIASDDGTVQYKPRSLMHHLSPDKMMKSVHLAEYSDGEDDGTQVLKCPY